MRGSRSFRLRTREIRFRRVEILSGRRPVLEQFADTLEGPFGQAKIAVRATSVCLRLAEIRRGDQRQCFVSFDVLTDVRGDLRHGPREGRKHARGHAVIPDQSPVQVND